MKRTSDGGFTPGAEANSPRPGAQRQPRRLRRSRRRAPSYPLASAARQGAVTANSRAAVLVGPSRPVQRRGQQLRQHHATGLGKMIGRPLCEVPDIGIMCVKRRSTSVALGGSSDAAPQRSTCCRAAGMCGAVTGWRSSPGSAHITQEPGDLSGRPQGALTCSDSRLGCRSSSPTSWATRRRFKRFQVDFDRVALPGPMHRAASASGMPIPLHPSHFLAPRIRLSTPQVTTKSPAVPASTLQGSQWPPRRTRCAPECLQRSGGAASLLR